MSEIIYDPSLIDFEKPGKSLFEVAFHLDATWGYAMVPLAVINGAGTRKASVVCFGGTHGNEYEGQVSVWRLMHELDPEKMNGRVILIPRLNPPACDAGKRESPIDPLFGNMNRAFPGDPHGSITRRIADFVTIRIFPLVQVVLDIHAAGTGSHYAMCSSFHMVKDPKQYAEIKKVASLFDTPIIMIYSSEMARGLLTDEAEGLGKITIGGEFGHSEGVLREGIDHAYEGMRNVFKHYGIIDGAIKKIDPNRPTPPRLVAAIHLDSYIPAPFTGVFEPCLELGTEVKKGQLLGRLYDFQDVDRPGVPIIARTGGYLILQPFQAPIHKGKTMIVIADEIKD